MRSSSAAALLKGQGFEKVYSMRGGISAWHGLRATGEYEAGLYLLEGRKTTEEFISLAWSLEEGARVFYETAGNVVAGESPKTLFGSLAKAEEKHKADLLEIYRLLRGDNSVSGFPGESLSGVMESGVSVEEAVTWLKQPGRDPLDILEFSMQLETNSLDYYMKVQRETDDKGAQEALRLLIDEEKRHLSRLGNMLNSMYNV